MLARKSSGFARIFYCLVFLPENCHFEKSGGGGGGGGEGRESAPLAPWPVRLSIVYLFVLKIVDRERGINWLYCIYPFNLFHQVKLGSSNNKILIGMFILFIVLLNNSTCL